MTSLELYLLVAPLALVGIGWTAVVWFERH